MSCPSVVRDDCARGATQLEAAVPTVVFAVEDGTGNDLTLVTVSVDGERLADKLDGKPLEVDPGEHVFRLEAGGRLSVDKPLLIREGEKDRRVRVEMASEVRPPAATLPVVPLVPLGADRSTAVAPVAAPPSPAGWGSRRVLALAVAGAGIVGLGVGTVTGIMTFGAWGNAKSACGAGFPGDGTCRNPSLATSDRSSAETSGGVSTVAFVAGGLALATGAFLFLSAPSSGGRPTETIALVPMWGTTGGGGGGGVQLRGDFQ